MEICKWLFINTIFSFFLFSVSFAFYVHAEKEIDRENERRINSFFIANELRQSSDDLTRMVRTYVATGEKRYKEHYEEILAIRDGKKPRPMNYRYIYWDLVGVDDERPTPFSNKAQPLINIMRGLEFSQVEFNKLAEAKMNSDTLTKIEFEAMRLVEQNVADSQKIKNKELATKLLNDENYHKAKAFIMRPIDEFYVMVDERTSQAVEKALLTATILRVVFILFTGFFLYMIWRLHNKFHTTIGTSVSELHEHIKRIGKGDFSQKIDVTESMRESVIGWLAQTQTKLLELMQNNKNLTNLYAALSQCNKDIGHL